MTWACHPPCLNPFEVSSSGPPGACRTPSIVTNVVVMIFRISRSPVNKSGAVFVLSRAELTRLLFAAIPELAPSTPCADPDQPGGLRRPLRALASNGHGAVVDDLPQVPVGIREIARVDPHARPRGASVTWAPAATACRTRASTVNLPGLQLDLARTAASRTFSPPEHDESVFLLSRRTNASETTPPTAAL